MRQIVVPMFAAAIAVTGIASIATAQEGRSNPSPQAAGDSFSGDVFHAQVLLDRAGFSPGVIDGLAGQSLEAAVRGYQEANGLRVTGQLDNPTRAALLRSKVPSVRRLRISEDDARGPFGPVPDAPEAQAELERLAYRNLLEKIAEKFHTSPETVVRLNPGVTRLGAGTVLRLPNVLPTSRDYQNVKPEVAQLLSGLNVSADQPKAARIVADKSDKVVRAYGENGRLLAQFPATMGSARDPLPLGTWKVNTVAYNPPFHYQPKLFWDVADSKADVMLPPGPNGPVGVVWIDLNREHIGIHGTNSPETIKRAESHGCVRLTNWDAARLTLMIEDGMPVVFQA